MSHKPQHLDKVWDERRKAEGKQPNGYIFRVWYDEEEVTVKFLDEPEPEFVIMSFDELKYKYTNEITGFMIHHLKPGEE